MSTGCGASRFQPSVGFAVCSIIMHSIFKATFFFMYDFS
jgi:NADH:ubiquinone oxidoreductase subunit 5 (subunit L)/multisubunit Na+/H+ antiporter MnhA subunit